MTFFKKIKDFISKPYSISRFFAFTSVFPIAFFATLLSVFIPLSVAFMSTEKYGYLYALIIFFVLMIAIYVGFAVYTTKRYRNIIIRGLYNVTVYNFKSIADNSNALVNYPNNVYLEFDSLNEQVDSLKTELDKATLIAGNVDYTHINLEYLDYQTRVITLSSFINNLEAIIFASQNYRNVIAELYYELGEGTLDQKEINYILLLLKNSFADYKDTLFIVDENKKSLLVYFPRIDSLSKIKEQCETLIKNATISKKTTEGIVNIIARFAVVCYPFSDVHELFPDLQYAKRQGEIVNFYLPNRLNTLEDNKILKNSMNLNTMSKLLSPLLSLQEGLDSENSINEVKKVIHAVEVFFSLDYSGIITYHLEKQKYYFTYQSNAKNALPLSRGDGFIEKEFVQMMDAVKDDNNSYYFSSRRHANSAFGRHLDRAGLESGFFYVLKDGDFPYGAIYFFNNKKEWHIDSYIQESLVILCNRIATILLKEKHDIEVESVYQEIDAMLKLSDYYMYRITKEDHVLLKLSKSLQALKPHAEVGQKCYEALYGLNRPCHDCPLATGAKKFYTSPKGKHYETSLALETKQNNYHVLAVKHTHEQEGQDRYHQDLLINSYPSLLEAMDNCYSINGRGYLLLLRVDNLSELVESQGSEGYLSLMRAFIKLIKKKHNSLENIYFFNNQVIALLFTEYGQTDIINECEMIYGLSRNKEYAYLSLDLTYLPISYPRIFPNAMSFLKQAEQYANKGHYETGINFIYLDEGAYSRSASKDTFMLSVIERSFGDKTFNVMLQPICDPRDKHIFGAELLLRITDDYRNIVFRTDELVKVAADHDKIGIISHALLDYIGDLYRQYGISVFDVLGVKRLSLNTDYSFFADDNIYKEAEQFINDLHLPRNFLAFEIPESDVSNHINEFRHISRELNRLHITIVCDQYSGRYLSLEILKNIGFNEVKIGRNIINHIDSDQQRLNDVKVLLNNVKEAGLKASVVGVENIDQFLLLKEIDSTMLMQGFYLHRPLEKQALIEAIRGSNQSIEKEDD